MLLIGGGAYVYRSPIIVLEIIFCLTSVEKTPVYSTVGGDISIHVCVIACLLSYFISHFVGCTTYAGSSTHAILNFIVCSYMYVHQSCTQSNGSAALHLGGCMPDHVKEVDYNKLLRSVHAMHLKYRHILTRYCGFQVGFFFFLLQNVML